MKKMRLIWIIAGFLAMGSFLSAQTYAAHQDHRQRGGDEFDWYIRKGVRSGELSDRELHKLRMEWKHVEHVKRQAYDHGRVTRREERRIWEAEKEFEKMLHVFMNNRERDHHRKYEKRHREDRYDRYGRR